MLPPLLAFAASVSLANARLSVINPLSAQLPPVARVGTPFEWTIAKNTFSADGGIAYSAPTLPDWLSFDSSTRTLHGTPSSDKEGTFDVTIAADDSHASRTSNVKLVVTNAAPPVLQKPLSSQLLASNPSLSSVFVLHNNSALASSNPTLRIPPEWSFSIGFEWNTYTATDHLYYDGLEADGSPLPTWVEFSSDDITFHGVTPRLRKGDTPMVLSLALHASDFEGYSASALVFDIVVASHELSILTSSLPSINVTAATAFNVSLTSPADFQGVLLDDAALQPTDLLALDLDTSNYGEWLAYDHATRTLSGTPPHNHANLSSTLVIPAVLTSQEQQRLHTTVSLAIVPSYFTTSTLDPITVGLGEELQLDLSYSLSNLTIVAGSNPDVELTADYEPPSAGEFLAFDSAATSLSGVVPKNLDLPLVLVTFTAYSHNTHSTSHISFRININLDVGRGSGATHHSLRSRRGKVILALQIACGISGGLLLLGILLAAFRRYASADDTALQGEEGRKAWNTEEKRYYGFDESSETSKSALGPAHAVVPHPDKSYGDVGRDAGHVSKAEFFSKLRSTVRTVSDKYSLHHTPKRPVIGKPVPLQSNDGQVGHADLFNAVDLNSCVSSNADPVRHSSQEAPYRRPPNFAPPYLPTGAISDLQDRRTVSVTSTKSTESSAETLASVQLHESEAVVHTASRARSVRSEKGASGLSYVSPPGPPIATRPRLVPFTSSSRVPRPSRMPPVPPLETSANAVWTASRVASQRATVMSTDIRASEDWSLGAHYVQTLGEDGAESSSFMSAPITHLSVAEARQSWRSSGSFSLASSKYTTRDMPGAVPRILARAGERFKFQIPVMPNRATSLLVRLMSGNPLPEFMDVVTEGGVMTEVFGMPRKGDEGEVRVGVFDAVSGQCLGKAVLEIVVRA